MLTAESNPVPAQQGAAYSHNRGLPPLPAAATEVEQDEVVKSWDSSGCATFHMHLQGHMAKPSRPARSWLSVLASLTTTCLQPQQGHSSQQTFSAAAASHDWAAAGAWGSSPGECHTQWLILRYQAAVVLNHRMPRPPPSVLLQEHLQSLGRKSAPPGRLARYKSTDWPG